MPRRVAEPDLSFAHSAEGIDRAETLATSTMDHFITAVDMANLDTTIAATVLVTELLAGLKTHGGVEPQTLLAHIGGMIDKRAAELKASLAPAPPAW